MQESRPTPDVGFDATITPVQATNPKIITEAEPVYVNERQSDDGEDNEAGAIPWQQQQVMCMHVYK